MHRGGDTPAIGELVAGLREALEARADPARATAMAAYMQHHFSFLGVPTPERRAAQRPTIEALNHAAGDDLITFAGACWAEPERELQYSAADALRRHERALAPGHLLAVGDLITSRSWWDTVDSLASHTVGPLVRRHPELIATMDLWIASDNLWLARTAILHQLLYKHHTDADRLFAYADQRASDNDFFVRKALGWALRQYARTDPDAVRAYVTARSGQLSELTRKEALKHL
jgi:3-methyladenine DNA glycosylase AlkD